MRKWDRPLVAAVIVVVAVIGSVIAGAPRAEAADQSVSIVSVELVGDADTRFEIDGRRYRGPVTFTRHADGLAFTERASIDQYLEGIAEMPFLWNQEALAAQAVAARTYLTYRLNGGRAGDAARYGFDICATSRCQVYRGVQYVEGDSGDRWRFAVQSTRNQLVLHNGRPIEAVYGSMVG
ncbi:MAG: SpoIID/LytB domain-containing protein, partial [Acidimicrobiia bacterium]